MWVWGCGYMLKAQATQILSCQVAVLFTLEQLLYFGPKQSFPSKTHTTSDQGNALMQCVCADVFHFCKHGAEKTLCVFWVDIKHLPTTQLAWQITDKSHKY